MIPDEAVLAGSAAIQVRLEKQVGLNDLTRAVLEAAAPHLMALALEEAARELSGLPYVKPDSEDRADYERVLAVRRGNTDAWLRDRAKVIRARVSL